MQVRPKSLTCTSKQPQEHLEGKVRVQVNCRKRNHSGNISIGIVDKSDDEIAGQARNDSSRALARRQ